MHLYFLILLNLFVMFVKTGTYMLKARYIQTECVVPTYFIRGATELKFVTQNQD